MKQLLAVLALGGLAVLAQDRSPNDLKHLTVRSENSLQSVSLTAQEIVFDGEKPEVAHLKGRVEVKTPVCVAAGKDSSVVCDGHMVLRADEADYHEGSGEIEARGNVRVTREKRR